MMMGSVPLQILERRQCQPLVFPAISTNSTSPNAFFQQMPEKPNILVLTHWYKNYVN